MKKNQCSEESSFTETTNPQTYPPSRPYFLTFDDRPYGHAVRLARDLTVLP